MEGVYVHDLLSDAGQRAMGGGRPRVRGNQIVTNAQGRVPLHMPNGLVVNSLLSGDEWRDLDTRIVGAIGQRLVGVQRLIGQGLTYPLGDLGTLVTMWQTVGEMTEAKVNMTGQHTPDEDRATFGLAGVPVPITHKEFHFGTRELEASRKGNNPVDTTNGEAAARVVAEKLEEMLFSGLSSIKFDGRTIYGYQNHPNRITGAAAGDWGTITNVIPTIATGLQLAAAQGYDGPFDVYLNSTQYMEAANAYFTDGSGQSPLARLRENNPDQINGFFRSSKVTAGSVVLVQTTTDVVDYAYIAGMMPTTLEWVSGDGLVNYFKVLSVGVPRIKTPQGAGGKTGIVVLSGA